MTMSAAGFRDAWGHGTSYSCKRVNRQETGLPLRSGVLTARFHYPCSRSHGKAFWPLSEPVVAFASWAITGAFGPGSALRLCVHAWLHRV
jgi:hypothetical protein